MTGASDQTWDAHVQGTVCARPGCAFPRRVRPVGPGKRRGGGRTSACCSVVCDHWRAAYRRAFSLPPVEGLWVADRLEGAARVLAARPHPFAEIPRDLVPRVSDQVRYPEGRP